MTFCVCGVLYWLVFYSDVLRFLSLDSVVLCYVVCVMQYFVVLRCSCVVFFSVLCVL